ncbi:hypothetical protein ACIQAA_21665 [Neobacillus sp. NPDC093182]|uniref:hypothetical protein n=1 Tax=Neobacillus sp. NPDC093182 TaxID=3364297 RepID=UPI0037F1BA41
MIKHYKLFSIIVICFSMFLLSACGSGEGTANKILGAVQDNDFETAKHIYEKEIDKATDKREFNDVVSSPLQEYINDSFDEIDIDIDEESSAFYSLLVNIEEIGVFDGDLSDTIEYYKAVINGESVAIYSADDSYVEEESYEEEEYYEEEESYEEEVYNEDEEYYEENPYTATDIDHDCPDFETGYDAQLFYEANGGPEYDPHDLDRDNDGMACDWDQE